jgi:hypothetical protein
MRFSQRAQARVADLTSEVIRQAVF